MLQLLLSKIVEFTLATFVNKTSLNCYVFFFLLPPLSVCQDEVNYANESHVRKTILYTLVVFVGIESITIFGVALFVVLRRRKSGFSPNNCKKCAKRSKKKKMKRPVFRADVNIYQLRHKKSNQGRKLGPVFNADAYSRPDVVTTIGPFKPPPTLDVDFQRPQPTMDEVDTSGFQKSSNGDSPLDPVIVEVTPGQGEMTRPTAPPLTHLTYSGDVRYFASPPGTREGMVNSEFRMNQHNNI